MIATPAEHEAELLRAAAELELARIRASILAAQARHCPQCGQPILVADTPAGARDWPPRSGWRERGSLL